VEDVVSYETYTVDQLLDANTAMNERADGLFERLARISSAASGRGVEVRVNLEGRLIALDLSVEAMDFDPAELAAEIYRLTQEASAAALSAGLAALEPVAGAELTEELTELIDARPKPRPASPPPSPSPAPSGAAAADSVPVEVPAATRSLDDHDDFSAVESWALPR
jgi:hypothetical protein